ncbi:Fur family transcriptional regulator [Egibacter rhizosphaerae]|nr:Fur family transcriptional regulator [Egibacter rhizosphaerae]
MDVGQRLRDSGYRLTPQRQLVWDVLRHARGHLTAEEIHERVSETVPDFNVASVYRTLSLLSELDLVQEVNLGDGKGHWEIAHSDEDFHLVCRGCATVEHHTGDLVERLRGHLGEQHGFVAEQVDIVVHGVCEACRTGEATG